MPDERTPDTVSAEDVEEGVDAKVRFPGAKEASEVEPDSGFKRYVEELEGLAESVGAQPAEQFDADFEKHLDSFENRARIARERQAVRQAEQDLRAAKEAQDHRGLGLGLTIAYTIIGVPLAGAGIGWLSNGATGSDGWIPIGTGIGAVLGLGLAIYLLSKSSMQT